MGTDGEKEKHGGKEVYFLIAIFALAGVGSVANQKISFHSFLRACLIKISLDLFSTNSCTNE